MVKNVDSNPTIVQRYNKPLSTADSYMDLVTAVYVPITQLGYKDQHCKAYIIQLIVKKY